MSQADDAYTAAEAAIAQALRDGDTRLSLDTAATHALTRLPPDIGALTGLQTFDLSNTQVTDLAPLQGLTGLQTLDLDNTQVTDLAPLQSLTGLQTLYLISTQVTDLAALQGLTGLQTLWLNDTQVTDLAPLQSLTGLQTLYLDNTQVTDLRPIRDLTALIEGAKRPSFRPGLHFTGTPAARATPELTRLSEIEDHAERAEATLAYLHTLPPWPQPLPWEVPGEPPTTEPGEVDQDAALRLIWGDDGFAFFASQIAADPVISATLSDLRDLLNDLRRLAGNQHEDLYRLAEELIARCEGPDDSVNHLKLHLSYQKLKRLHDGRTARTRALDDETVTAMEGTLELIPGVTLADPGVRLLIERQEANRAAAIPGIDAAREAEVLTAVQDADAPFEADVKDIASAANAPGQDDRLAATRPTLARNVLIATVRTLKWGGAAAIAGVLGNWAYAHLDTLQALALSMGDDVYWWARGTLDMVKGVFEARTPGP